MEINWAIQLPRTQTKNIVVSFLRPQSAPAWKSQVHREPLFIASELLRDDLNASVAECK